MKHRLQLRDKTMVRRGRLSKKMSRTYDAGPAVPGIDIMSVILVETIAPRCDPRIGWFVARASPWDKLD